MGTLQPAGHQDDRASHIHYKPHTCSSEECTMLLPQYTVQQQSNGEGYWDEHDHQYHHNPGAGRRGEERGGPGAGRRVG